MLHAGTHGPQPVPQDLDKKHQDTPTSIPPPLDAPQPPPTADSPRPSQPPADDMPLDAPASDPTSNPTSPPPSHPPSQTPSQTPSHPSERPITEGHTQAARQMQHRLTPLHGRGGDDRGRRQLLREHVVHVAEAAACLPGLASNEEECKKVPLNLPPSSSLRPTTTPWPSSAHRRVRLSERHNFSKHSSMVS